MMKSYQMIKKFIPMPIKSKLSGFKKEIYSKRTYLKFQKSKKNLKMPDLSPKGKEWLSELTSNGFCKISRPDFLEVAERLEPNDNKDNLNKNYGQVSHMPDLSDDAGISNYWCSFRNLDIQKILFDKELLALIYNYAGGQLFYRQSPILERHYYNGSNLLSSNKKEWANLLHTDYHLQIVVFLLLSDITPETTKTIYATGSNSRNFLLQNGKVDYPESAKIVSKSGYKLEQLTGKKGDMIIIDTGGFHAAEIIANTKRTVLTGVLNSGLPFLGYHEDLHDLSFKNETESFVIDTITNGKSGEFFNYTLGADGNLSHGKVSR